MSRRPAARQTSAVPRDPVFAALSGAGGVLWLARFLVPAETADQGETLWIVAGWLLLLTLAAWARYREGRFDWRPGWPEVAVGGLALAQVLAAIALLWTGGNLRSALNMSWEWIGVGAAFVLLRQAARDDVQRQRLLGLTLTAGVVLAGLGVWQRYVWYPQVQAAYREWEQLTSGATAQTPATRRRMQELREELGPELLALDGTSQAALKQRVLDSHEPFGRFGLTNTLGGVLAAVLVLLSGCWPVAGRGARMSLAVAAALVATTLMLTRSRTAWLAALAGLAFVALVRWRAGAEVPPLRERQRWSPLVVAAALLLTAGVLAAGLGAIDRQDLQEAPKSVLYRAQYFTATWRLIQEHLWLGVGPGNFRQRYLQYKLPEASEEISDPHNLYLDAWATGGILSLAALCGLTALAMRLWNGLLQGAVIWPTPVANDRSHARWLVVVGVVTCALVFLIHELFARRTEWQLAWLAAAWVPAAWCVDRWLRSAGDRRGNSVAAAAAGLALSTHALMSGGFAMPVVCLLGLVALFVWPRVAVDQVAAPPSAGWHWSGDRSGAACACGGAVLLAGSLWTGWGPTTLSGLYRGGGNAALFERRPDRALQLLNSAAEADPLDPTAWRDLSYAQLLHSRVDSNRSDFELAAAVQSAEAAIARDPHNPHSYRWLGDVWMSLVEDSGTPDVADRGVRAYQQALERYPHSSRLESLLSTALAAAQRPADAAGAAGRALRLDDINRQATHYDKTFSEHERSRLEMLRSAFQSSP